MEKEIMGVCMIRIFLKYINLVICISMVLCFNDNAYCFDDSITHPALTEQAANRDPFINYLKNQLGFSDGHKSKLRGYNFIGWPIDNSILKWLQIGSTDEDDPTCRAANHFHDPTKAWTDSYVTDSPWLIEQWCRTIPPVWPTYSNITWATGLSTRNQTIPDSRGSRQDMGWDDARKYFYSALTEPTPENRNYYFVKTFRAVGQTLHLLQDMAVPAHVRNDFQSHLDFNGKKGNSLFKPLSWFGNAFEYYVKLNSALISSASPDVPTFSSPRFTDYWDTDGNGAILGLAEFTNGFFFSDETMPLNNPTAEHTYTYPKFDSAVSPKKVTFIDNTTKPLYECEDNITVKGFLGNKEYKRKYLSQETCPTAGGIVDHFVASSFLNNSSSKKLYALDNNVHDTYAKKLIPKAVGYSAALLDYFFRGKINLSFTPTDISFRSIKVTVQNNTPVEDMGLGDIALVIRYKALAEKPDGGRYILENPPEGTATSDYTYKVIKPSNQINLKDPTVLTFDLSNDPLPMYFDDMTMQLVYKGPLGNETGAVAVSEIKQIDGIYSDFAVSLPPSGVYAKVAGESIDGTFNELRVTATTDIPGGLTGGSFKLYLEHTVSKDDPYQSVPVAVYPDNAAGYLIKADVSNGITPDSPLRHCLP